MIEVNSGGPAIVLGNQDVSAVFQKQVSRKQCKVEVVPGKERCTVVSIGLNPTLIRWRAGGETLLYCKLRTASRLLPENALEREEIGAGDHIGLLGTLSGQDEALLVRVGVQSSTTPLSFGDPAAVMSVCDLSLQSAKRTPR
jgi:hypothetical protein